MSINPKIKDRGPTSQPAGQGKGAWLAALEQGADMLQTKSPLKEFDVYLVGFHPAKSEPDMQMEAHHFCKVVNDDFIQCVLFDGNTQDANLIGIEYIVSGSLLDGMPAEEKTYWHPHNFEIFSGQLVAPGLPKAAETQFMKKLINSYGKTWHLWHTGGVGSPGTDLPYGEPSLMWSFNREGEGDPSLVRNRDEAMGIDSGEHRQDRQNLLPDAEPQHGVNTLKDHFPNSTPIPGVVDVNDRDQPDGQ